jgi:FkbM family methyltransferase
MLEIRFFVRKWRTHGPLLALAYTLDYLIRPLLRFLWLQPVRKTFSQRAEDLVIDRLLGSPATGFYVDIGANHPTRLSNTRRFYDRGWNGCNVEPDPRLHRAFELSRPRDTNLCIGLAQARGRMDFFRFDPDVYSTFSRERAEQLRQSGARQLETLVVEVETLAAILRQHSRGRAIDFLSVDTEGLDLSILRGNDWQMFRPKVVCVEAPGPDEDRSQVDATSTFLASLGYIRHSVTEQYGVPLNEIYVDEAFQLVAGESAAPINDR